MKLLLYLILILKSGGGEGPEFYFVSSRTISSLCSWMLEGMLTHCCYGISRAGSPSQGWHQPKKGWELIHCKFIQGPQWTKFLREMPSRSQLDPRKQQDLHRVPHPIAWRLTEGRKHPQPSTLHSLNGRTSFLFKIWLLMVGSFVSPHPWLI